jgi:hypothetical protein
MDEGHPQDQPDRERAAVRIDFGRVLAASTVMLWLLTLLLIGRS